MAPPTLEAQPAPASARSTLQVQPAPGSEGTQPAPAAARSTLEAQPALGSPIAFVDAAGSAWSTLEAPPAPGLEGACVHLSPDEPDHIDAFLDELFHPDDRVARHAGRGLDCLPDLQDMFCMLYSYVFFLRDTSSCRRLEYDYSWLRVAVWYRGVIRGHL